MVVNKDDIPLFWIDPRINLVKSYSDLLHDINSTNSVHFCLRNTDTYQLFVELLCSMLTNDEFKLLDSDWSSRELINLGIEEQELSLTIDLPHHFFPSLPDFLSLIGRENGWRLGFFTSGTTGRPKFISHTRSALARNVKTGSRFLGNIWGFCYNPTHFAGIQVFLQAIYNQNTLVNLFNIEYDLFNPLLHRYAISHISATPTYYRSVYPYLQTTYPLVQRLTFGGEMFDEQIATSLIEHFPNARITNVYASTELGSILAGKGNTLKIPIELADCVRVSKEGELQVHKSLMGDTVTSDGEMWFSTGDLVTMEENGRIRFFSRKSEMINVGGYKVNPHEIEAVILELPNIRDVVVYGRENRITGKVIAADVTLKNADSDIAKQIRGYLKNRVQDWKIPRIIKVVDEIDRTRTGKKVRK